MKFNGDLTDEWDHAAFETVLEFTKEDEHAKKGLWVTEGRLELLIGAQR
jgi:hypothetical protein